MSNIIVDEKYLNSPITKPNLTNKALIISSILAGMKIEEYENTLVAVSEQKTSNGSSKTMIKLMSEDRAVSSDVQQIVQDLQSICKTSCNTLVSNTTPLSPDQKQDSFPLKIDEEKAKSCPSAYVGYNLGGAIVAQKDVRMNALQFQEYRKNIKLQMDKFKAVAPKYGYTPETISDIENSLASMMTTNAPNFYNQNTQNVDSEPVMQRKN